jgi:hypothetical protein
MAQTLALSFGLAALAGAVWRIGAGVFHGNADPSQGRGNQEITHSNQNREHCPQPQCSGVYMRFAAFGYKLRTPPLALNGEAHTTDAVRRVAGCGLDPQPRDVTLGVMLQRNAAKAPRRAHLAHAAVVGMHALCCGLPALAMLAAALSGTASAAALLPDSFVQFHRLLHGYELWILGLSAALVALGAWMEAGSRRSHPAQGFPWLFAFSVLCFLVNAGVIFAHNA